MNARTFLQFCRLRTTPRADRCFLPWQTNTNTTVRHCGVATSNPQPSYLVTVDDVKLFVCESMEAVGAKPAHSLALAEVLVLADQRGHYSHGLNRLGLYAEVYFVDKLTCTLSKYDYALDN